MRITRLFGVCAFAGLILLLLLTDRTRGQEARRPNILLITLDTTRADHLGCYGYGKPTSPNVDRLASQGARFVSAFASLPITLPSHTTMMTGLYPFRTGVRDNGPASLPASTPLLASILKGRGYQTLAYVSSVVLDRAFGLDRGFDVYDDSVRVGRPEAFDYDERAASQVNQAIFESKTKIEEPFFLWVHYYDPHMPYVPPHPFVDRFQGSPYDGEIAFADWAIGKLLDFLASRKLMDNTIVVIAGDHGEGLGDHGELQHGAFLYSYATHVPLLIRFPGHIRAGTQVQGLSRLIDITPTLLDYAGLPAPRGLDGISLRKAIGSGRSDVEEVYQETVFPENNYGWSPLFAIRTPGWLLIQAPTAELYDVSKDPRETTNLQHPRPEVVSRLSGRLARYPYRSTASTSPVELSPELREQISSLGYVTSPPLKRAAHPIDPKEGMLLLQKVEHAKTLANSNQLDSAIREISGVLLKNPENVDARTKLGNWYAQLGKPDAAIREYQTALEYREFDYLYFDLGNSEAALGRFAEAVRHYEKAVSIGPRFVNAYLNWATLEINRGNAGKAKEVLDRALSHEVRDPGIFILCGRVAAAAGDSGNAEMYFTKALEQNPEFADGYSALGQLYFQQERFDDAILEYRAALKAKPDDIRTLKTIGSIYLIQKADPRSARPYFERALALAPDAPDASNLRDLLDQMAK